MSNFFYCQIKKGVVFTTPYFIFNPRSLRGKKIARNFNLGLAFFRPLTYNLHILSFLVKILAQKISYGRIIWPIGPPIEKGNNRKTSIGRLWPCKADRYIDPIEEGKSKRERNGEGIGLRPAILLFYPIILYQKFL